MQKLGVEVLAGRARFINQNSVEVSSSATAEKVIFSSRYFVVATGSRPRVPKFAGSDRVRMLTNGKRPRITRTTSAEACPYGSEFWVKPGRTPSCAAEARQSG